MSYNPNSGGAGLVLRSGEYLLVRQADAGTASDTRKAIVDMFFEEYA